MTPIQQTVRSVEGARADVVDAAWERQHDLTKPRGSLGRLEGVAARVAGSTGRLDAPLEPVGVAVFAADHGVHAAGVSPWPQEVTAQMVAAVVAGSAAVSVLARRVGARTTVVDLGVVAPVPGTDTPVPGGGPDAVLRPEVPGLLRRRVRTGTDDLSTGPAMTPEQARQALEVGIDVARRMVEQGDRILVAGDLGITNTTASAALVSVFTGADPAAVTGRGTGIDDATLAHKTDVVRRALALHRPDPADPVAVLAAVGGLEHAGIAGFLLGAAAARVPVVLDGVIACSAALVAAALAPAAVDHWIAGHRSQEPGATAALTALGLDPVLDLDLRLGEGTGAVLAVPVVQAAYAVLDQMATFSSLGIGGPSTDGTPTDGTPDGTLPDDGTPTGPTDARPDPAPGGRVVLVGGGPGDPGLLTVRGLAALQEADVVVTDRLAPLAALAALPDHVDVIDVAKVPRGPSTPQDEINDLLVRHARAGRVVVRLKGGDGFVLGRGIEEVHACRRAGVPVEVVPGVTSATAVPALAGIPVTDRDLAQGLTVVSAHVPPGDPRSTVDWAALAASGTTLVVLMGVHTLGAVAEALVAAGQSPRTPAACIQDGGMPGQLVVTGTLADIAGRAAAAGVRPPAIVVIGAVAAHADAVDAPVPQDADASRVAG